MTAAEIKAEIYKYEALSGEYSDPPQHDAQSPPFDRQRLAAAPPSVAVGAGVTVGANVGLGDGTAVGAGVIVGARVGAKVIVGLGVGTCVGAS